MIAEDLAALGLLLRPLHPHHHAQPPRGGAGAVPRRLRQRLLRRADDVRRDLARRPAAPCPTATSRAPARSAATTSARGDQCDNCGNQLDPADLINPRSQDQRRDAGVRRDPALLPRPAGAGRRAGGVARRARGHRHLAAQRDPVQPEHPQGDPAARDDPRHRLGHPGPARRLARQPDQAALRLVRRGHRLPVGVDRVGPPLPATRSAWRDWWNDPTRRCPTTSWARTTSPSTARSGRPSCWPTPGEGDKGGEPREYGELNLPTEVVSSEFLTMEGKKFSSVASAS